MESRGKIIFRQKRKLQGFFIVFDHKFFKIVNEDKLQKKDISTSFDVVFLNWTKQRKCVFSSADSEN